jgi:hypothetical protein
MSKRTAEPHLWVTLSPGERREWLRRSRDLYFAAAHPLPQAAPGHVFELVGSSITDLTSFLCAMGEAINGPGGYFGSNLNAFEDCCWGGFGATPPFSVRWADASASKRALDHAAMAAWAREQLECLEQLAERERADRAEGAAWLARVVAQAERGEGETLFDLLVQTMRGAQIAVEEG